MTRQGKSTLTGKSLDKLHNFFVIIVDLGQEAHAIRSHALLPLDENCGDTRQMLARMGILSNEMLVSVELHLSRALMSKRLELKVKSIFFGVVLNNPKIRLTNHRHTLRQPITKIICNTKCKKI